MRASHTLIALASGLPLLLGAGTASAHLNLVSPTPRLQGEAGGTQLKTKPCGQTTNARTADKVTTFTPGQKVDIKIKEYINHPGYFAVAFDPDGDNDFPFPRANMDKINATTDDPKAMFPLSATVLGLRTDKEKDCYTENNATHECTISITIPNMTCSNCTLQVTQFMYDKLGDNQDNEYYYQCADIKIEGAVGGSGSGGSAGAAAGGAAGAAGSSATGGTAGAATAGAAGTSTGGTPASTGGTPTTTAGTTMTAGTSPTPTAGTGGSGTVTNPAGGAAEEDGGCGMARGTEGGAGALAALGLLFALVRRRRAS